MADQPTRKRTWHADFVTFDWAIEDVQRDPELASESIGAAVAILQEHRITVTYVGPDREANSHVWRITGPDLVTAADALDVDVEEDTEDTPPPAQVDAGRFAATSDSIVDPLRYVLTDQDPTRWTILVHDRWPGRYVLCLAADVDRL